MTMTITREVPETHTLTKLLSSVFEGGPSAGANKWHSFDDSCRIEDILEGGSATVLVMGQDTERSYHLTLEGCLAGWQVMHDSYPQDWLKAVSDESDANVGDTFLQCCLFGEVIYG